MEKVECPACAGPDNAMCATCSGTNEVTQEVLDAFNENKQKLEELFSLRMSIEEAVMSSETRQDLIDKITLIIS